MSLAFPEHQPRSNLILSLRRTHESPDTPTAPSSTNLVTVDERPARDIVWTPVLGRQCWAIGRHPWGAVIRLISSRMFTVGSSS